MEVISSYKDPATEMFDIIRAGGSVKCPLCKDEKIVPVGVYTK